MQFQFTLEKYKGSTSRFTCPNCNTKQVFVRYVDSQTGEYLDDKTGRCNRESKCGHHYTPKQFFAENPTNLEQLKSLKSINRKKTPSVKTIRNFDHIPVEVFSNSLSAYEESTFVQYLSSLFESSVVMELLKRYFVGTWRNGRTVFWQIDPQKRIRTGKILNYDSTTGKRKDTISFVHSELKKEGKLSENFELEQCFFGEHLLSVESKDKALAIVESAKTAIISSFFFPEFIWISTEGKANLNAQKLKKFAGRNIVLFPDSDGFDLWKDKANEARKLNLNVVVSDLIDRNTTPQEKQEGFDLADYLLRSSWDEIESINAYIDRVLINEELFAEFNTIIDERIAIAEINGNLSSEVAASVVMEPQLLREIAVSLSSSKV